MEIISYNINGIRAALKKGLDEWLKKTNPDIVCFQELKANIEDIDVACFEELGYNHYWFPAQKKGYSGVGILSKREAKNVVYGMGHDLFDYEGRVIRIDIEDFSLFSIYFPSGSSGDARQSLKMEFLTAFKNFIDDFLKTQNKVIICGDYNICHRAIDIHDPIRNKKSSGFLPEEREWLDNFLSNGFVDTFRHLNSEPNRYSWWSYRARSRAKNLGWRIDYNLISQALLPNLQSADILDQVVHSDHCPLYLKINY